MAYDLLFRRHTRRNWARLTAFPDGCMGQDSTVVPTDTEKQLLAKMAVLKMAAAAGHKGAKQELRNVAVKVLQVRGKAAAGDPKAQHIVAVLRESKIFAPSTSGWSSTSSIFNPFSWFQKDNIEDMHRADQMKDAQHRNAYMNALVKLPKL